MYTSLGFVMPVHNEEHTLEQIIATVMELDLGLTKELVVVNDGSQDRSAQILQQLQAKYDNLTVITNHQNIGKSQSVKKGLLATKSDLVVIQDADLEYDPNDLKQFVLLFQQNAVDVVYGNRFGRNNKVVYLQNWLGNSFLSLFSSLFTGLRAGMWTRDMEVCYKMANGSVFRDIALTLESKSTFGLEPEITAKFSKYKLNGRHLRFKQLPISYFPRTIAQGKQMHALRDGLKALREIIVFNLRPLVIHHEITTTA